MTTTPTTTDPAPVRDCSDAVLRDPVLPPARRDVLLDRLRQARDAARAGVLPDGSTWAAMCLVGQEEVRRARHDDVEECVRS